MASQETEKPKLRLWNRSYTARLTLSFAAVALMTALIAIAVLYVVWEQHFQAYTTENMAAAAESAAVRIAAAYEFNGGWSSETTAAAKDVVSIYPGVGIQVIDAFGTVRYDSSSVDDAIASSNSSGAQSGTSKQSPSLAPSSNAQVVKSTITVNDQVVGEVRVWIYGSQTLLRQTDYVFRRNSYEAMILTSMLAVVLASCMGYLFARVLVNPINHMTRTAKQIAKGNLAARTGLQGEDEVSQLGVTFDEMAESVENSLKNERRLTTDVAHELRSPLQVMQMNVEAMIDGVYPLDDEHLIAVDDEVKRLSRMVSDLLELSRLESGSLPMRREPVDLDKCVGDLVANYDVLAVDYGLTLSYEGKPGVKILGDSDKIRQTVANLVSNAVRYTPEGGSIMVTVGRKDNYATIAVKDTGIGLTDEETKKVFDRFWRADESRTRESGGLGIGLSVVREIVERHGGWVQVSSRKGKGTCFTVHIPLYDDTRQQNQENSGAAKGLTGKIARITKADKTGKSNKE